jgi:hypothetical protein
MGHVTSIYHNADECYSIGPVDRKHEVQMRPDEDEGKESAQVKVKVKVKVKVRAEHNRFVRW